MNSSVNWPPDGGALLQNGRSGSLEQTLGTTRSMAKNVQPNHKKRTVRVHERAVNNGVVKLQRCQLKRLKARSHQMAARQYITLLACPRIPPKHKEDVGKAMFQHVYFNLFY